MDDSRCIPSPIIPIIAQTSLQMIHRIENERLSCTIDSNGAEIRSLKDKQSGKEYIWQIKPEIWGSSSPVLFPAIGKIKEDQITLDGKSYAMPKHGIVRHHEKLIFAQESASVCSFTLHGSEETHLVYPYAFSFTIQYRLIENRLIMSYLVENRDMVPMHFACGGHTAYACPLSADTSLSDYVIEFPSPVKLQADSLGSSGLLSYRKRDIPIQNGLLPLSETLFNEDALIFSDISFEQVRLRKKQENKGVIVRFPGYPNLALWAKPGADYVCIEPWLGLPDREDESIDISKKSSLRSIEPDSSFLIAIETEIE